MSTPTDQPGLFDGPDLSKEIEKLIDRILQDPIQPSALELCKTIEEELGIKARWDLGNAIRVLSESSDLTRASRAYLKSLLESGDLDEALRDTGSPQQERISSIDLLLRQSRQYGSSKAFQELIDFMGSFRDYSPFNNMLVRLQNPSCSMYATEHDWHERFGRKLIEDARPMLILAPMHPVMLVYDIDQTEGPELPQELRSFSLFGGDFDTRCLTRLIQNANGYRIDVKFKTLSSTNSGFATVSEVKGDWKRRIVVHDQLDDPSRFGVLCHELAHVLLGHLGSDLDYWWPARENLGRNAVEIEAESVAWIVTKHLGLDGSSPAYVSRHLHDGHVPFGVSLDIIAKTSGLIERMATTLMPPKQPRVIRKSPKRK
ncbi:MAG: hypothetical protein EXS09_10710 [Gemmataceae bacterium]|nr:hypothetical protein [Gemmataceae bacterium]